MATGFQKLGIQVRFSCPYSHQQNGLVERKHQHITEVGLSHLAHSSLPMQFWWLAFQASMNLINVIPIPVLKYSSPYKSLYNLDPDYQMLKVFGCACYLFLRPYNSSKLQFRSTKCDFLGYCTSHKGYYCLHPSGRIYVSPTIEFN